MEFFELNDNEMIIEKLEIPFEVKLENTGNSDATDIKITISVNEEIIYEDIINKIERNQTVSYQDVISLPEGKQIVNFSIDPDNQLAEIDELNWYHEFDVNVYPKSNYDSVVGLTAGAIICSVIILIIIIKKLGME